MAIHYTEETINEIFSSDEFLDSIQEYENNKSNQELLKFLNSITTNSQYFRLGITRKKKYNKSSTTTCNDTDIVKEINQSFNKLTDINVLQIYTLIRDRLLEKKHLVPFIIENILNKCISQYGYISLYVQILQKLHTDNILDVRLLHAKLETCYQLITTETISDDSDEYSQLCNRNKKMDNLIGYSILVTHLEINNLITDKIKTSINDLLYSIQNSIDVDNRYEYIQCLYNILKIKPILDETIQENIQKAIDRETSMKNKFKLMDILDL